MDFLNKYFAQIKELFDGMTPGARITSALLLAVTLVSLGYLVMNGVSSSGEVYLLDNRAFTSDELTPMLGAFATDGLKAPEIEAGRIKVPRGQEMDYIAALVKAGALPHDLGSILDTALNQSGTFEDKTKFQARMQHGRQRLLSEMLGKIKGVERAQVLFDEKTKPGLLQEQVITSTVWVKPVGSLPIDTGLVHSIRLAMTGAVAGLASEDVVVIDANTGKSHRGLPGDVAGGEGTAMAREQRIQEQHYREKIEDLLGLVPGVTVTPTVELAPEKSYTSHSATYDKDGSLTYQLQESKSKRDFTGESRGGRPGYVSQQQANTPRALPNTEAKGAEENETTSELSESKLPAGEEIHKEYAPYAVKRVSVAITVPTSYFKQVWRNRNQAPPGEEPPEPTPADIEKTRTEETDRIKGIVAGALPTTEGVDDLTKLVTVTDFEDVMPPPPEGPSMVETAGTWFGRNWSTLGLIGLGLVSLLMLRSMIRSGLPGNEATHLDLGIAHGDEDDSESSEPESAAEMVFSGTGASLRDELSNLVATDPETAANILRNWIGTAAK